MSRAHGRRAGASIAAFAIAVFASIVVLAPAAAAAKPAVDQYDLHIPTATGTGGGGSDDGDGGSSAPEEEASAAETGGAVPVASTTPAEPAAPVATSSGDGGGNSGGGKPKSDDRRGAAESTTASLNRSAGSLPTIEDDAGDVWLPILLAGLAAIGAVAAFLVYRRRRTHA